MPKCIWIAVLLLQAAAGPARSGGLSFEVASVKPAAACCAPGQWRESTARVDRIDFPYVTLRYCVAFAYGVKEYQVSGPAWLGELRFDILAKGAEGTRQEQLPEMLQTLLAERFKMQVRREKKEFSVLALQTGRNGPKLEAAPKPSDGAGGRFALSMSGKTGKVEARNADMAGLANTLQRLVGQPVVNLTALAGRFDFDLEFSPGDAKGLPVAQPLAPDSPPAAELGVSVFTSLQRLGLKLDAQKIPLDAIVVERADKVPVEN